MFQSRFPRSWSLAICLAALFLFAGANAAKRAQYEPKESCTHYLAKAVKITTSPVATGDYALPSALPVAMARPVLVARLVQPEQPPARQRVFLSPLYSRPPPAASL